MAEILRLLIGLIFVIITVNKLAKICVNDILFVVNIASQICARFVVMNCRRLFRMYSCSMSYVNLVPTSLGI